MRLGGNSGRAAVGAAVALVVLAGACSSDGGVRRDAQQQVVEAGTGDVFELQIGDCFTPPGDLTEEVKELPLVPCAEPHSHEVFELAQHPAADGENYPGKAELDAEATTQCVTSFDDYVGIDWLDADGLFFTFMKPSIDSWNGSDRTITCVVGTTGGLLTRSVAGSNGISREELLDPDATPAATTEPDPS